eukprot:2647720-Pyramimonas_sp.AAC.1
MSWLLAPAVGPALEPGLGARSRAVCLAAGASEAAAAAGGGASEAAAAAGWGCQFSRGQRSLSAAHVGRQVQPDRSPACSLGTPRNNHLCRTAYNVWGLRGASGSAC